MAVQKYKLLVVLLVIVSSVTSCPVGTIPRDYDTASLNRTSFPQGFIFGTASSAYQYEGNANKGGRGPSIWDTYSHKYPDKIKDGSNGDVAVDAYHHYKEDVRIMKNMGMDAYRFSISWSRLLPNGKLSGGVNKEGIDYYNNLIDELLANGINPFVTLFHWDLPQALEDEYSGFLSPNIVNHFRDYAELCFKEFGDRVKHWITFNEPLAYTVAGYALGFFPPARCSKWQNLNCTGGNSATEPYLVTHNELLAHAAAVKLYKDNYQATQKGLIGITLVSLWVVPYSNATHDKHAASRALDFMLGWFMDPLIHGNYPHSMRSLVKERLPKFTEEQSKLVKGSFDFIGLNYYTANYAAYEPLHPGNASYYTDNQAKLLSTNTVFSFHNLQLWNFISYTNIILVILVVAAERNGISIGPKAASDSILIYPRGIRDLLLYTKRKYHNPLIYITENGVDEPNDPNLTLEKALIDNQRVDYYYDHLHYLQRAIKDGVNVKGYFAWSLLDNYEWTSGYTVRFGINYVDYKDGLKRYPKLSACWFQNFLRK